MSVPVPICNGRTAGVRDRTIAIALDAAMGENRNSPVKIQVGLIAPAIEFVCWVVVALCLRKILSADVADVRRFEVVS